MTVRTKKLVGLFVLVPGLAAYLFLAAAIGERVPSFWLLQIAYYAAAGMAWAAPAILLMNWINKPPRT